MINLNLFRTAEDYELFVYTLKEHFSSIRCAKVSFIRRGATLARVAGEIYFDYGIRLVIRERLIYNSLPIKIDFYGYEVWLDNEKLYWYDSQSHPHDSTLQATYPHHKHIPPDIKHHRITAPQMSFTKPNLPRLIQEIEVLIKEIKE